MPVKAMLWLVAAASAGGAAGTVSAQDDASGPARGLDGPCSAPEYRQLDFWIGAWRVRGADGTPAGSSRVERILGGCVLQENWEGANGWSGKSFNAYDRVIGAWRQFWVSAWGAVTAFTGEATDGQIVYRGDTVDREGKPALRRLTLTRLGPDRIRQLAEMSYDSGASWRVDYDFTYTRDRREAGEDGDPAPL